MRCVPSLRRHAPTTIRRGRCASSSGFRPAPPPTSPRACWRSRMSQTLGQQVVVENRPGAGIEHRRRIRRPRAEGRLHAVPRLRPPTSPTPRSLPTSASTSPRTSRRSRCASRAAVILVVHPSTGVKSVQELIALAKSKPGEILYASTGVGTTPHLSGELFTPAHRHPARARALPGQPAGGDRPARRPRARDVLARLDRDVACRGREAARARLGGGAAAGDRELPADHGGGRPARLRHQHLVRPDGAGRHAARGRRQARRASLNEAVKSDEVVDKLKAQGFEPLGGGPEELARFIETEMRKWSAAAQAAGLKK